MSLTNPNKVVTEERLAEFYGQLLPYLGGMPEAVVNKFSKSDLYSTTEKIVGCWTNGKPLYQKTISCGNLPNNNVKTVAHGVSNLDSIKNIIGYTYVLGGAQLDIKYYMPIPNHSPNVAVSIDSTSIYLQTTSDLSTSQASVTIQYTKTTDAANSFNFSTETDYSTTEKIVGTWIDGKPLYQKTINFGALPNTTTKSVNHNISNLKDVINISGWCSASSGDFFPIPLPSQQAANKSVLVQANATKVQISTGVDYSSVTTCYVTLQYTKTTD